MGCGCSGKKNTSANFQKARLAASPPRINQNIQQQTIVAVNNIKPLAIAPTQIPKPTPNDVDRKARQKARQDARLRALGRI